MKAAFGSSYSLGLTDDQRRSLVAKLEAQYGVNLSFSYRVDPSILGGLVVRKWCQDYSDIRVRRLVMIGTPNCGAEMADMLQRNWLYRGVFGPSGQQLIANTAGYISKLPPPTMEFAVIAGAKGTPDGYNPLIPGDDDGIVTLKSAFLPGAVDSLTVRGLH